MIESVLIIGSGPGLSAALARLFAAQKMRVILPSRNVEKLNDLKNEIKAETINCDSSNYKSVSELFK